MKRLSVAAVAAALLLVLAACQSRIGGTPPRADEAAGVFDGEFDKLYENLEVARSAEFTAFDDVVTTLSASEPDSARKVLRNGKLTIETLGFDDSVELVGRLVAETGGYISASNVTGVSQSESGSQVMRRASMAVRVPGGRFDEFISRSAEIGNVLTLTTGSEDITAEYFDIEANLKILELQKEALEDEYGRTEVMTERMVILDKIFEVQGKIEALTGTLKKYGDLLDYSVISIDLREVMRINETKENPVSLGQKVSSAFDGSLEALRVFGEGFVVFIIGFSPILIFVGIIAAATIIIVRVIIKKQNAKSRHPARPPAAAMYASPADKPPTPPPSGEK